jgi:predicted phage-related endonuclease
MEHISALTRDDILSSMAHDSAWHRDRAFGIGGSDAAKIMSGDWLGLWMEKTDRADPDDLSNNLAVQMGTWTEPLNRVWFTKQTGIPVRIAEPLVSSSHPFMRANLDGLTDCPAVFEAKHVGAYVKDEELVSRYYPQLQHQMAVADLPDAYLSAFFGSNKWAYFLIARDDAYIADLVEQETAFWDHVLTDEAPQNASAGAPAVVIAFDSMRTIDMTGNNEFAASAFDWLQNHDAAKAFDVATKAIKDSIPSNVKLATGHGISASRNKSGALSIKRRG